jgi:hypothetical protein
LIASRLRLLRGLRARQAVELQVGHDAGAGLAAGINEWAGLNDDGSFTKIR